MQKEQLAEHLRRYHHGAQHAVLSKELERGFGVSGKELRIWSTPCAGRVFPLPATKTGIFTQKRKRRCA